MLHRFSACIEMLFKPETGDICERVKMAADAGFEAIEFWGRKDKDLDRFMGAIEGAGMRVAGFLAEPMLPLADPNNRDAFLRGFEDARDFALAIDASMLIVVSGAAQPGVPRAEQRQAFVACLADAAAMLAGTKLVIGLEPVNVFEHKNAFLWSLRDGLDIVDAVGRPELRLLCDMFHAAVGGENVVEALAGRVDRVAHVHLADHPGRHEPGTGTLPWRQNLVWLDAQNYAGTFGFEYNPASSTLEGLNRLEQRMWSDTARSIA